MIVGDRVVTTAFLRELNQIPECDELQLGGVLDDLEGDALHVLVPTGHTHGLTEMRIVCQVHLAVGGDGPLVKEVLISPETYESLPTTFSALTAARGAGADGSQQGGRGARGPPSHGGDRVAGVEGGENDMRTDAAPEGRSDGDPHRK